MLTRELADGTDLLRLQSSDPARYPLLLESVAGGNALSRWDLLLVADGDGLRLDAGGHTQRLDGRPADGDFLQALDADWRALQTPRTDGGLPFRGGWALFLAYELAGQVEPSLRLPQAPGPLPRHFSGHKTRHPAKGFVDPDGNVLRIGHDHGAARVLGHAGHHLQFVGQRAGALVGPVVRDGQRPELPAAGQRQAEARRQQDFTGQQMAKPLPHQGVAQSHQPQDEQRRGNQQVTTDGQLLIHGPFTAAAVRLPGP